MAKSPSRSDRIDTLGNKSLDVLIVGGGIVGAGIARDAAMRGLSVGLVDRGDFACGTSSRSSRMLHGGLRYLSQGKVMLVREANIEKRIIERIAPHLAAPMPFVFPAYRDTAWPLWQMRFGVKAYDLLCGLWGNFGKSISMSSQEILDYLPGPKDETLRGGVKAFDGITNDSRLVIDTLMSAQNHRATLCNYVTLVEAHPDGQQWRCLLRDMKRDKDFEITVPVVVNATGPWADGFKHSSIRLRRTKGVHLAIPHQRLPVPDAVMFTRGNRFLFAMPWGNRIILGSTDTDYNGSLDDIRTDADDIDYVLDVVNEAFPHAALAQEDISATWAGVRPLIATRCDSGPSDISRRHVILSQHEGWIDVAGGKLTTYRLIAQQATDRIEKSLDRRKSTCQTANEPLLETDQRPYSGLIPCEATKEAVGYFCRQEWAEDLNDIMFRRGGWDPYLDREQTIKTARQVASWMARELDWSEEKESGQLSSYMEWSKIV